MACLRRENQITFIQWMKFLRNFVKKEQVETAFPSKSSFQQLWKQIILQIEPMLPTEIVFWKKRKQF